MTDTAGVALTARRAQTRERLMAAANQAFADRGIFGASVEDICEAAGFTRGAFYSNFASKDELVLAMLRREVEFKFAAAEQAITLVRRAAEEGRGAEEVLSTAVAAFVRAARMDRDWVLTQQELVLYAARRPEVRDAYQRFSEQFSQEFGALISEGLSYAGLEFSIDYADAIALLTSCHQQDHLEALLDGGAATAADAGIGSRLELLLRVITRPSPR